MKRPCGLPLILFPALVLALVLAGAARADEIMVPAGGVERDGPARIALRIAPPLTAPARLTLDWTDAHGRLVARHVRDVSPADGAEIAVTLDLRRARAMRNRLALRLQPADGPARASEAVFIARPPPDALADWHAIYWQRRDAAQYAALKRIGVDAGVVMANREAPERMDPARDAAALLANDLRWYVENIATDFYAAYHRWTPDRPPNWLFQETRRRALADPDDATVHQRSPSLEDAAWRARIRERIATIVRIHAAYRPLNYNLADEPGIADLAAFWDFDLGPDSLAGFRAWLRTQYPSLDALNRQWDSAWTGWDAIRPEMTDAAMRRRDGNFSAWFDFKAWMDVSFANAVADGIGAVRAADPGARGAIKGGQIPGWGGWNYPLLAPRVDVLELGDYADAVAIARDMNPRARLLTTDGGEDGGFMAWRQLLRGAGGIVIWDDAARVVGADGALGKLGEAMRPWLGELRGGLGALVLASPRAVAPVAMLHSPASLRVRWLLDHRAEGPRWRRRGASSEYADTAPRRAARAYAEALGSLGIGFRYIDPDMLAGGELARAGIRLLILPHVLVLDDAAIAALGAFLAAGGVVVADTVPGAYDGHGRARTRQPAAEMFRDAAERASLIAPDDPALAERLRTRLGALGIEAEAALRDVRRGPVGDVEVTARANGAVTLLALQRRQPGGEGRDIDLRLPRARHVLDVRAGVSLGAMAQLTIGLPAALPVLLALSDAPLPGLVLDGPERAAAGEWARFGLGLSDPSPAARHVVRLTLRRPDGSTAAAYSGIVALPGDGTAAWEVPFALNDPAGMWEVEAADVLTGRVETLRFELAAP